MGGKEKKNEVRMHTLKTDCSTVKMMLMMQVILSHHADPLKSHNWKSVADDTALEHKKERDVMRSS